MLIPRLEGYLYVHIDILLVYMGEVLQSPHSNILPHFILSSAYDNELNRIGFQE